MKYTYDTENTCSRKITFDIESDKITNIEFVGGCDGNLKAISKIVDGLSVDEIEQKCSGIVCGNKNTSCADQLAKAVRMAFDKAQNDE